MFYPRCRERYERFTLNPWSSLYDGLVFGGLGPNNRWSAGQGMYEDSTCYLNDGTLIGYTGAGNTPADKWQWNPFLRRFVLGASEDGTLYVNCGYSQTLRLPAFTILMWIKRAEKLAG